MMEDEKVTNENPHCNDYDSEGRCNQCGQFDCYECDWGYPFDDCNCWRCKSYREEEEEIAVKAVPKLINEDLEAMSKEELIAEIKKLRAGAIKN